MTYAEAVNRMRGYRTPAAAIRLARNRIGRDFVVGDIQGTPSAVDVALRALEFDTMRDRLFCVGDLVDRDTDPAQTIEFLGRPYVFALRDDRAQLLLAMADGGYLDADSERARGLLVANHTEWWLEANEPARRDVLSAIRALPIVLETATADGVVGFVHAEVPRGMSWASFFGAVASDDAHTIDTALNGHGYDPHAEAMHVRGVARVFVGHTVLWPASRAHGNVVSIEPDTVCAQDSRVGRSSREHRRWPRFLAPLHGGLRSLPMR